LEIKEFGQLFFVPHLDSGPAHLLRLRHEMSDGVRCAWQMCGKEIAYEFARRPLRPRGDPWWAAGGIGQGLDRAKDVLGVRLGVVGQGRDRLLVAGQGLDRLDVRPRGDEGGDVACPQGMEVGEPGLGLVGDPGGLQVAANHLGRLVVERQHEASGGLARQPGADVVGQGDGYGLLDLAAVLGAGRELIGLTVPEVRRLLVETALGPAAGDRIDAGLVGMATGSSGVRAAMSL